MKSEWRVSSQYFDGVKEFEVYRLRDTSKVDHNGNREYVGGILKNRDEAKALAAEMNKKNEP